MKQNISIQNYTALIFDEHKNIRNSISELIQKLFPEIKYILKASNALKTEEIIVKKRPVLIFYDVCIGDAHFQELIEELYSPPPVIIFLSLREGYTRSRLEIPSGYILSKPIQEEEFQVLVEQAIKQLDRVHQLSRYPSNDTIFRKLNAFVKLGKMAVPIKNGIAIVAMDDVKYIQADNSYSILYLQQERLLVCRSIQDFEQLLRRDHFFRIHNSYIINLHYLERFSTADGGTVQLKDGIRLQVAKRRLLQLKEVLHLFFHKI